MKRSFLVLLLLALCSTFALAGTATLTPVRMHRDKRVQRHQAHKAGKHPQARRQHRHGV